MGIRPKDLKPKAVKTPSRFEGKGTRARLETAASKMMFSQKASA